MELYIGECHRVCERECPGSTKRVLKEYSQKEERYVNGGWKEKKSAYESSLRVKGSGLFRTAGIGQHLQETVKGEGTICRTFG